MTPEIGLLLVIAAPLVLFSLERVSADVVALGALVALILTGLVTADQAFAGFGNDVVVMILGSLLTVLIYILSIVLVPLVWPLR